VDVVANKLGRAKILIDRLHFRAGMDLRAEVRASVEKAALFVFFASRKSLESDWCQMELDQADLHLMRGGIEAQLTVVIDPNVSHADLPKWMQLTKVISQPRAAQTARDIQGALFSLQPDEFKPPFVGRTAQARELIQALSMRHPTPRIIMISGLEGIGRRTYLERAFVDNLGLRLGPFFLYDETKRPEDLYLWLFDETGDFTSRSAMKTELEVFSALSPQEQLTAVTDRIGLLCQVNCAPCFIDHGGLLDDNGRLASLPGSIVETIVQHEDWYFAIALQRMPLIKDELFAPHVLLQGLPPLDGPEAKLLLQQLLKRMRVNATPAQITELLDYLGGYPPAIYLAATHAKTYGMDLLMADKSVLVDFQVKRFTGLLAKLSLEQSQWKILQYLMLEQAVPLSVVALAANMTIVEVAPLLRQLIERSLVIVTDDNYSLASPIRSAVERVKGLLAKETYADICQSLTDTFWAGEAAAPTIEIVDATLHAAARGGAATLEPYSDLLRASTLHRLGKECYNNGEYDQAFEYLTRAEKMGRPSLELDELLFKCLVRLEKWDSAEAKLEQLRTRGAGRHYHYLRGFMFRLRRRYKEAVECFRTAENLGHRSLALARDYADCLHRLGKDDEAMSRIEAARTRDPANIYILDLYIRVSVAAKKMSDAEKALAELERYDVDHRFYHHRHATFLAAKGLWTAALKEAKAAIQTGRGTFEAHAEYIDILIELTEYKLARQELDRMRERFKNLRRDVQRGLLCKLLLRQKDWRSAEEVWNTFENNRDGVGMSLGRQIFEMKSQDPQLSLAERQQARDEAAFLDPDLTNTGPLAS